MLVELARGEGEEELRETMSSSRARVAAGRSRTERAEGGGNRDAVLQAQDCRRDTEFHIFITLYSLSTSFFFSVNLILSFFVLVP